MNFSQKIFVVIIFILVGASYFYAPVFDRAFISRSPQTCTAISYTCPQYQEPFTTGLACGCVPTGTDQDDPDTRTLHGLAERHIKAHVAPANATGDLFVSAAHLGLSKLPSGLLAYDVLALFTVYANVDGILTKQSEYTLPVHLSIEETGQNYIVRDAQFIHTDAIDDLAAVFGIDTADWLSDTSETAARTAIEAQLQQQNKIKGIQALKVGPIVEGPAGTTANAEKI